MKRNNNPKIFNVRKEWRPDEHQVDKQISNIDKEKTEANKYYIIDGKPFIWTLKDHEDVKNAYYGRKVQERKPRDYIEDGMNEILEGIDW